MANFWQRLVENLNLLGEVVGTEVRVTERRFQRFVSENFLNGHEAGTVHQ